ncbi:phosphoribosylformylglycinamidine cyclo-ligase [Candidatus Daviesbacteria bacterium]|nr:phosphoribosylformylglycinamidine cyclo-ligase [Candidatus Daviesbacteria bacterium]
MSKRKLTYSQVGDDYSTKDPTKKIALVAARQTAEEMAKKGYREISDTRGESAFVWATPNNQFTASVIEGLGTKNLVADAMRKITGKTYYDTLGHDTVATIINDLITVGAKPMVIHAYWGVENNSWLQDEERMNDLITGWKEACILAEIAWGGGETPTLKGIIVPNTIMLGGSAVGVVPSQDKIITDSKLKDKDRILLLKSNGINTNGLSLARAIAKKLPAGYSTKLNSDIMYGEALLTKTNIYARLVNSLISSDIDIHYISNITGHGHRKIMRSPRKFTYYIENIFEPQEVFLFTQKYANLSDYDMYEEFNMGMDYAIFLQAEDADKALEIIKHNGFEGLDAGYIEEGERKVVIKPKNIIFEGISLDLR